MIIKKISQKEWQIKVNNTTIELDGGIQVGEYKVSGVGEYEISGVEIEVADGIIAFIAEDIKLVFISCDKHELSESELKRISNIDVLFLPVASENTMNIKTALKIISEIEPNIIIPTYYTDLDKFTKSEGMSSENISQLKISKNTLPQEGDRKVVILE